MQGTQREEKAWLQQTETAEDGREIRVALKWWVVWMKTEVGT